MPSSIKNKTVVDDIVLTSPIVCLASNGRTVMGVEGTVYVSGSLLPGASDPEICELRICPGVDCGVDSNHAPVVYSKLGENGSVLYNPFQNSVDVYCILGSRIALTSNETFLHTPSRNVPYGWGIFAYEVYVSKKDSGQTTPNNDNSIRTAFLSRTHKNNINNSSTKTDYMHLYHDETQSTNSLQTFANNAIWNSNAGNLSYGIIWCATVQNTTVITGARCLIKRV